MCTSPGNMRFIIFKVTLEYVKKYCSLLIVCYSICQLLLFQALSNWSAVWSAWLFSILAMEPHCSLPGSKVNIIVKFISVTCMHPTPLLAKEEEGCGLVTSSHECKLDISLRRQPPFCNATTASSSNGFPAKWRLRNQRRNCILMMYRYPDMGRF